MQHAPFFVSKHDILHGKVHMLQPQKNDQNGKETADINLATFIKVIKGINTQGHYFKGTQLRVCFDITETQLAAFKEEYINSPFSNYDATRRNFLRLLKRAT